MKNQSNLATSNFFPKKVSGSETGFWIAEALGSKEIVVAVPSLALIKQTLNVWTREYLANGIRPNWLAVCSDESAGEIDSFTSGVYDIGVPCTTDSERIRNFLQKPTGQPRIVFTTYHSGRILAEAARSINHRFDLGIMDEAHKTVGHKDKVFAHLIDDSNIRFEKRIFMTATERFFRGTSDEILSMDDPDLYGETFEFLTFKQAIEIEQIICDYRFVTIAISESEIRQLWEENAYLQVGELDKNTTRSLASGLALRKAYSEFGIKRAISFHRSIKLAKDFTSQQEKLTGTFPELSKVNCFHVSSKLSTGERAFRLRAFASAERGLITNARCLTEGVDIPSVDCVMFVDPKQSKVDIVQAAGRALRKSKGKSLGYIIVPLVVPENVDLEEFANSTEFAPVVATIKALAAEDERIVEYFHTTSKGIIASVKIIDVQFSEILSKKLDASLFINNLILRVWTNVARLYWQPFEEAREFAISLNLKNKDEYAGLSKSGRLPNNIPSQPDRVYKDKGWLGWGDWLGTGNVRGQDKNFRPFEEAREYARSLNLKNKGEYVDFAKSDKKPNDIPASPIKTYKDKGWSGWGDWLGTGNIRGQDKNFRPFEEAREYARSLNLRNKGEYVDFAKSDKKPNDIPASPIRTYKDKGWSGWGDWLGTGNVSPVNTNLNFRPFEEAREYARSLNLKNKGEYIDFAKSDKKPNDIPASPIKTYKDKGWLGWGDWLVPAPVRICRNTIGLKMLGGSSFLLQKN